MGRVAFTEFKLGTTSASSSKAALFSSIACIVIVKPLIKQIDLTKYHRASMKKAYTKDDDSASNEEVEKEAEKEDEEEKDEDEDEGEEAVHTDEDSYEKQYKVFD